MSIVSVWYVFIQVFLVTTIQQYVATAPIQRAWSRRNLDCGTVMRCLLVEVSSARVYNAVYSQIFHSVFIAFDLLFRFLEPLADIFVDLSLALRAECCLLAFAHVRDHLRTGLEVLPFGIH